MIKFWYQGFKTVIQALRIFELPFDIIKFFFYIII